MLSTGLNKRYHVKYPICNVGVAHIAGANLASAMLNARCVGFIGAGFATSTAVGKIYADTLCKCKGPLGIDFITPLFNARFLATVLAIKLPIVVFCEGFPDRSVILRLQQTGIDVWLTVYSVD